MEQSIVHKTPWDFILGETADRSWHFALLQAHLKEVLAEPRPEAVR